MEREKIDRMKLLKVEGKDYTEISRIIGCSCSTVKYYLIKGNKERQCKWFSDKYHNDPEFRQKVIDANIRCEKKRVLEKRTWKDLNPEKSKKYMKEYNQKYRKIPEVIEREKIRFKSEKYLLIRRKWSKENPNRIREYQKRYVKKNPDKIKEYQKRYVKKNPDKIKKWANDYVLKHKEEKREYDRKRIERLKNERKNRETKE